MQAHAIAGPWETGDRVLACISEDRGSAALVRYTRRLADRLHAPWTVLHVETPHTQSLSEADRDYLAECQRLAEKLGGTAVTIPGADPVEGIINYAETNNFSHLAIARTHRPHWSKLFRGSTPQRLIQRAQDINIHVMADRADPETAPRAGGAVETQRTHKERFDPNEYLGSFGIVFVAFLLALALRQFLGVSNIALVFLTGVLASAVTYGLWPALFACLVSVFAFNFFFLPPLYTLTIADPENVLALFSFAIVAIIASNPIDLSEARAPDGWVVESFIAPIFPRV